MEQLQARAVALEVYGVEIGAFERDRITSYNVCYTKLLRDHGRHLEPVPEDVAPFPRGSLRSSGRPGPRPAADRRGRCRGRGHRITSYNVCYTKLLRAVCSPSRRVVSSMMIFLSFMLSMVASVPLPRKSPRITSYNVCYTKLLR